MLTVKSVLQDLISQLLTESSDARVEAEIIVQACISHDRAWLYANPTQEVSIAAYEQMNQYLERRKQGEPLAYILEEKDFWTLSLKVTPATLIPRPETECLVAWILQHYSVDISCSVADLGTGSGAIALALANERPHWYIEATDISEQALAVAQYNAKQHAISSVHFSLGSWCSALSSRQYDIIVSNPPYIAPEDEHLAVLCYEPQKALVSDEQGLYDIQEIVNTAWDHLTLGGVLMVEHGFQQGYQVQELMHARGYGNVSCERDLSGHSRFCIGVKA